MKNDKDTNKLVIEVTKLLQVEVAPEHISTSHRWSPKPYRNSEKNSSPPPIFVRVINRDICNRIYDNGKLTRNLDMNSFSVEGTQHIFVNENLTQQRKKLFWKTKQRAKTAGFKFC